MATWAFFGPGRYDPTALRLGLEIFGTAAAAGAIVPSQRWHVGACAFAAAGFTVVGLASLDTTAPLAWLAAALLGVAIVDAAHEADRRGRRLGAPPVAAAAVGVAVATVTQALL